MSPTLKLTGVGQFVAKLGEEQVDRCNSDFNAIWDMGLSYTKEIV